MQIKCDHCGRRNNDVEMCKSCGAPLPEKEPLVMPVLTYAVASTVTYPVAYEVNPVSFPTVRIYTVQRGDSWVKIAREFYDDERAFYQLKSLNRDIDLCEGMKIKLPDLLGFTFRKPWWY